MYISVCVHARAFEREHAHAQAHACMRAHARDSVVSLGGRKQRVGKRAVGRMMLKRRGVGTCGCLEKLGSQPGLCHRCTTQPDARLGRTPQSVSASALLASGGPFPTCERAHSIPAAKEETMFVKIPAGS